MKKLIDGRILAEANEQAILRALHRFGWLRTRDLAALIWTHWSKTAPPDGPSLKAPEASLSGIRMAQRTLRRLRESRQVLCATAPDGSTIYALSEAGARRLRNAGIQATTGKDLIRTFSISHFRHRCVANEIAIGAIITGFRASTEREIARGLWLGGIFGIAGKKPDVLIQHAGKVWWVEVEKSRKNARDYAELLKWLEKIRLDTLDSKTPTLFGEKLKLVKVMFICTTAFKQKLIRDLESKGWEKFHIDALVLWSISLYSLKDTEFH